MHALTKQGKIDWARFLVSLLHRVPVQMDNIRTKGSNVLTEELEKEPDEYLDQRDDDTPEATLLELVNKRYPELLNDFGVMTLEALVQSPILNGALLNATWFTRRLEKSRSDILISDNPLIYLGTFKSKFLVEKINQSSVGQADREVYATNVQHLSFVETYLQK